MDDVLDVVLLADEVAILGLPHAAFTAHIRAIYNIEKDYGERPGWVEYQSRHLANDLGIVDSVLSSYFKKAEERGYMEREKAGRGGSYKSSWFRFDEEALGRYMAERL